MPDVRTQRALVAQLNAVAGTVTADALAWERCRPKPSADPMRLAACQARAYRPTAARMSALGTRVGQIGATVPGTHCAAAARAAATGMPAAAREWGTGQPGRPGGAVTPEGKALLLAYTACTARPVWNLNGFPGVLYGP